MSPRASHTLARGDTVGVVAPGFAVEPGSLRRGVARLEALGFRVALGRHVLAQEGYLAGDDEQRAADLEEMLRRPDVRAVWFARGGYGTARLLDRIPRGLLAGERKLLVGYSDLTALFSAALRRDGGRCLYGPVVTELGRAASYHLPSLRAGLAGRPMTLPFRRPQVLAEGRARGLLFGGNLSVLSHLCGTRFLPDPAGRILFLEDSGEQAYRIDRMLTQLRQAGLLRGLAGVLLGAFHVPPRTKFPPDRSLQTVLREFLLPLGVPVVRDLPAGHVAGKRTLPLGARVELDTAARRIRFTP